MRKGNCFVSILFGLAIVFGIACIVGGILVGYSNSLVSMNETVDNQWAQVENQLARQSDLIPNLVNTVKGYAKHEKDVFDNIAKARSAMLNAKLPADAAKAQSELSTLVGKLLMLKEAYPELKANESFQNLQVALEGTQNRITMARMDYNNSVKHFNSTIKGIPGRFFGYSEREYFNPPKEKLETPKVEF